MPRLSLDRLSLHLALAASLALAPTQARAAAPGCKDPDALYEEGRKEFNQKFYRSAIEKFEEAYRCSKSVLYLYNIGITYKRLYDDKRSSGETDPDYLRRAREALTSYLEAIEKDPSLGADPEEVKPDIAAIDAELERIAPQPAETPEGPEAPPEAARPAEDPGRKPRLVGIGLMSAGGALTVLGVAVGAAFAAKGRALGQELGDADSGLYGEFAANGCGDTLELDAAGADAMVCGGLRSERDDIRAQGKTANGLAIGFTVVGAVGLGLLVGGAIAFARGKRATKAWEAGQQARVRVLPGLGSLVIQGRF